MRQYGIRPNENGEAGPAMIPIKPGVALTCVTAQFVLAILERRARRPCRLPMPRQWGGRRDCLPLNAWTLGPSNGEAELMAHVLSTRELDRDSVIKVPGIVNAFVFAAPLTACRNLQYPIVGMGDVATTAMAIMATISQRQMLRLDNIARELPDLIRCWAVPRIPGVPMSTKPLTASECRSNGCAKS